MHLSLRTLISLLATHADNQQSSSPEFHILLNLTDILTALSIRFG
jgi:hypothetical protein